ncbi:MAG: endo alpha-1,4 polygalactosaminidase [Planctomycetes bacterium]|nr:endo alpha-1,4 polygalactosaminidase [Planctomycetota bacterium]
MTTQGRFRLFAALGAAAWALVAAWLGLPAHAVPTAEPQPAAESRASHDLPPVASFHYQLQNLDLAEASASPYSLLVTDYSSDGSEAGEWTPSEVAQMKTGGRVVLAYLSIGEAETYRYYFDPAWIDEGKNDPDRPAFLGPENPAWPGNFKVRYWDPEWQALIFGSPGAYLDRIQAQGFDGVYLDIVDAFEFFGPDGTGERPSARQDMIDFVTALAAYARTSNAGFFVVPQNAVSLVDDAGYLAAISGLGAEDTWFIGNRRQTKWQPMEVLPRLDAVLGAGKAALCIDYPTRPKQTDEFFRLAEAKGYAAYNGPRDLDAMVVHLRHPPSPGPSVTLDAPADAAAVSAVTPPTFTWTGSGAVSFELQIAGTFDLAKHKRLPKSRKTVLTGSSYTPTAREWQSLVRLTSKGDGHTLYVWVEALDALGNRRSSLLHTLDVSLP